MDQHEKYLYDLQGYITVPDSLDADQLRRLNEEVDRHIEAECPPDMTTHRFFDTIDWGGPLLEIIDNPRVRPYLDTTIGEDAYRLDHVYLDVIRSGKGPIGTKLHGGGVPTRSLQYYRFEEGRMWNGLSVVAYNLHDVGPMDGGFGAIPGSHKSNYPLPDEWKEM
ncbi:MAG: mitomycin antibiotics/polyketide fumonisin biosynthesis protein, partial [Chloroflexota bacterium]|nr:mitomycin antibiotics/polyketide fumonisin biosynthesis protein [Chloroflexota bacterium]